MRVGPRSAPILTDARAPYYGAQTSAAGAPQLPPFELQPCTARKIRAQNLRGPASIARRELRRCSPQNHNFNLNNGLHRCLGSAQGVRYAEMFGQPMASAALEKRLAHPINGRDREFMDPTPFVHPRGAATGRAGSPPGWPPRASRDAPPTKPALRLGFAVGRAWAWQRPARQTVAPAAGALGPADRLRATAFDPQPASTPQGPAVRRRNVLLHILHEDNHCLVVDKPAGVLVQPDRTGDRTIIDLVSEDLRQRYQKPGNVYVGVVHRLDRPVSGALLLARTSKAAARLSEQFRTGAIEKTYLALVEAPPLEAEGVLLHSLLKDSATNTVRVADPQEPGARAARLRYTSLGPRPGGTLLEVHLETGRAHQIRVQLAAIGCVIVGDMRYGSTRPLGQWIALHASRVAFTHPTRGERIDVTAPLPDAWEALD